MPSILPQLGPQRKQSSPQGTRRLDADKGNREPVWGKNRNIDPVATPQQESVPGGFGLLLQAIRQEIVLQPLRQVSLWWIK